MDNLPHRGVRHGRRQLRGLRGRCRLRPPRRAPRQRPSSWWASGRDWCRRASLNPLRRR